MHSNQEGQAIKNDQIIIPTGNRLECRVTTRSSRNAIKGMKDGRLQIAVTSPPFEGRANETVIELLSEYLNLPKSRIKITHGLKSRNKTVMIAD